MHVDPEDIEYAKIVGKALAIPLTGWIGHPLIEGLSSDKKKTAKRKKRLTEICRVVVICKAFYLAEKHFQMKG